MSYTLEAIIITAEAAQHFQGLPLVAVAQGFQMLPVTDEFLDGLPPVPHSETSEHRFWKFNSALESFIKKLSEFGMVAYLEVDFFGGTGTQDAGVWEGRRLVLPPVHTDGIGAVNAALRRLGVRVGEAHDEFEALGLARKRSTEKWLIS